MAINPQALLIFRARGENETDDKRKKKRELPKDEVPKPLGTFQPSKSTEPMVIQNPAPPASQQRPKVQEQPKPKTQPIIEQEPEMMASQPGPQMQEPEAVLQAPPQQVEAKPQEPAAKSWGFKLFRKKEKQEVQERSSVYDDQKLSYQDVEAAGSSINIFANREYISKRGFSRDKGQLSREAAKGMNCVWHPWRPAYAICGYCHRPFCFEDTMEFNKEYYCLEDIDNISSTLKEKIGSSANTSSIFAGILLMFAFLTFFYYSNGQVIFVFQYLNRVGLPFFATHMNYSYASALIESLFMLLGLATALLLFLQSRKGFYIGVFTCLCSVVLFSYQYITTATLYLGAVTALSFLGFVALLYSGAASASTTDTRELIEPPTALENDMIHWPNVGRF